MENVERSRITEGIVISEEPERYREEPILLSIQQELHLNCDILLRPALKSTLIRRNAVQRKNSLKAIVFDLDGTLIDTVRIHATSWVRAFEANGYNVGINEVEPLIGMAGKRIVKKLLDKDGFKIFPSIVSHKNRIYLEMIDKAKLFPRVQYTLRRLSRTDLKLALATSTLSYVLSKVLGKFCLTEFFDTIVAGDEVTQGKPSPEIFMRVFERFKLDPHLGAVVGDTEYDILPAIRIGATSIMITHGRRLEPTVKPDHVIDELPDLLGILEAVNVHSKTCR